MGLTLCCERDVVAVSDRYYMLAVRHWMSIDKMHMYSIFLYNSYYKADLLCIMRETQRIYRMYRAANP